MIDWLFAGDDANISVRTDDAVCFLVMIGAGINAQTDKKYLLLVVGALSNAQYDETVCVLLMLGADINAQTDETQETALTLACCGGFLEVADFLIKAAADIELGCSTPLMEAAQEGHLELVKYLLKAGVYTVLQTTFMTVWFAVMQLLLSVFVS